ncbi:MAG: hypothetical protein PHD65_08360 [Gallionella sp.]|nr:hypothetical protein [Gallionella sp.]
MRFYFWLVMMALSGQAVAEKHEWLVKNQVASPTTRVVALSDLGLTDPVALNDGDTNREQHFFFSVPQDVVLKDVRIEVRGVYLRAFTGEATLSFLVNGVPVSKLSLSGNEDEFSRPVKADDIASSPVRGARPAKEIVLSVPVKNFDAKKGFLDFAVVLSSRVSKDVRDTGGGNALSIDPKETGLIYTFDAASVRDIRSMLGTLSFHPVILLPERVLGQSQYEAALRTALALYQTGAQPEFVTIPKVGDTVYTDGLPVPDELKAMPLFSDFSAASEKHTPLKITRPEQIGAWLVLRALSPRGLAQIVLDSARTRKYLREALGHVADLGLEKRLASWGKIAQFDQWLAQDTSQKANVRVSSLAGQPVLLLDEPNMAQGAALIDTMWHEVANSRDELLDKALLLTNDEQDKTHFYFAQSQSVKYVEKNIEWTVPFKLSDLPEGKWPEEFEINLVASPMGDSVQPVASVFLNDNLLSASFLRTDGKIERVSARIPMYSIASNNYLKVQVRRRCDDGKCADNMQSYPVQMLPSSYLGLASRSDYLQFFMLPPAFGHAGDVILPVRYLEQSDQSLSFVSAILSSLSAKSSGINIHFSDKPEFSPKRTFVSFEVAPSSANGLIRSGNGQLTVRDAGGRAIFDGAGMGALATLQLVHAGGRAGVVVSSVSNQLLRFSEPLDISQGDFAVLDAKGVKLSLNLNDPKNEMQLDEQNRDIWFFIERYRGWLIALGLLFFVVACVYLLRMYFQRGANRK